MNKVPLYKAIASALVARVNCQASDNHEWSKRWLDRLVRLDKLLPSGGGFDNGSVIVKAESGCDKILIATSFHHMNENGFYDGWTEHRVTVKPDLLTDFVVEVSGRSRNDIKDFIADVFSEALSMEVDEFDEVNETADQRLRA